jgi:hypothetical protein
MNTFKYIHFIPYIYIDNKGKHQVLFKFIYFANNTINI